MLRRLYCLLYKKKNILINFIMVYMLLLKDLNNNKVLVKKKSKS
jgi:hypothetical protein